MVRRLSFRPVNGERTTPKGEFSEDQIIGVLRAER